MNDFGNFNCDTSSFSSSTIVSKKRNNVLIKIAGKIWIQPTAQQKAFVDIGVVFRPDENQQHEQQTLEQHQEIEYLYLKLIETDKVEGDV